MSSEPNKPAGNGDPRRSAGRSGQLGPQGVNQPGNGHANWSSTSQGDGNVGWVIISYLVAGMIIYGGLGWLVGHWLGGVSVATLIGVVVGLTLAITLVIFRYGRS